MHIIKDTPMTKDELLNRFELAIEGSGFGIWQCDLKTGLLSWDKKMHEVYGYGDQVFSGDVTEWKSLVFPEDQTFVNHKFESLLSGQRIEIFEFRILTPKTNEIRYIEANGILQKNSSGEPIFVIGMNRDITAVKKLSLDLEMEKLARAKESKLAALGEMAAGLAHEINNPISIILGHKQKLEKILKFKNENQLEIDKSLRIIEKTVDRISQIVKGLLSFSGNESNQELENKDLFEIIEEALFYTTEKIEKNKVQLKFITSPLKIIVRSRPSQLSQVLVNLISNSIDAIESFPDKWIEIKVLDLTTENVKVAFSDSGNGIPLHLQKKIVSELGGTLEIDATSEHTQFLLTLPIAAPEQSFAISS